MERVLVILPVEEQMLFLHLYYNKTINNIDFATSGGGGAKQ